MEDAVCIWKNEATSTVTCNHGIKEDSTFDWINNLDYVWQETKMLIMDNKHECLKISMKYSKIHASKCLNNFKLIIWINILNLIFNMAWIDLNIKVYNRDDISLGLIAQSSLKFLLYWSLRLHLSEPHNLLLKW